MLRIDHTTAVAALPPPEPAGTPGYFTKGNPAGGLLATRVKYDWLNGIQEEICGAIEGSGLVLDKEDNGQLLAAIRGVYLHGVNGYQKLPSGLILQWGSLIYTSVTAGEATVTLPLAFPTAFYMVLVSDNAGSPGGVQGWAGDFSVGLATFKAYCANFADAPFSTSNALWWAIGK